MRTRSVVRVLIFVAALAASGGCATIGHGVTQDIRVTSEPPGAAVFVGSQVVGLTPTVVTVSRRSSPKIRLELFGFEPLTVPVPRSTSGLVAGNAIAFNPMSCQGLDGSSGCGGLMIANALTLFGLDFLTGAAFKFPKEVRGVLIRK